MNAVDQYDVAVVGGGPGGFAAAVAASREGARTILLEREGCLGGAATTMMVHPFMSHLTSRGPEGEDRKLVNAGVFKEVVDRLSQHGSADVSAPCICFDDEILKVVLDEIASEAGVSVIFHAALFDAEVADGRVAAARFAHNSGAIRIAAKTFIDATGDALLASSAGCECMFGDDEGKVMNMSLMFTVAGVDTASIPDRDEIKRMVRQGDDDDPPLKNNKIGTLSVPREGYVHFNAISVPGDTLDPSDVTNAEIESRRLVENFVEWVRRNVPVFANCFLVKTAAHVGIRESRRVLGDYILTGADFQGATKFDDAIACCSYYADRHGRAHGGHLPPGEHYQIPYRCLTPKGIKNLLIAGRSISADVIANSSLRIMPTVMCIGQAAGIAAAMSLPSARVRDIDVQVLRRKIRTAGGVLEPQ
jgi:hypothetical protein